MTEHADLTRWAKTVVSPPSAPSTPTVTPPSSGIVSVPLDYGSWITSPLISSPGYFSMLPTFTFGQTEPKPAEPEDREQREDPFVGWKTLKISVSRKGNLRFLGAGRIKYGVDATAECYQNKLHVPPVWTCGCGFYALEKEPESPECGSFRAQVELFGTVIEGERGWRASRQRVLLMESFPSCQSKECGKRADGFQVGRGGQIWPICAKHAPLGYSTLADLAGKLGTEVRWVES